MRQKSTIKWGIIGCGDVTEVKSGPPYGYLDGFELRAVMRRNLDKATDYAKRHSVPNYYVDADKIIYDPEIDAVYIATPPDSHMQYALEVAKAGKPCCIEKPMASSYDECLTINSAFAKANIPLFIAYYRRSLPRFLQVKRWIDEGGIGTLRHIHWTLHKPPSAVDLASTYNWRTNKEVAPGGYFDDLASHGLDLFAFLIGRFKDASGYCAHQEQYYSAYDAISASWVHTNGCTGSGSWNFNAFQRRDEVCITGSNGEIFFSVFDENPIRLVTKRGTEELTIAHPRHIQEPHIAAMRDALLTGTAHPSTGSTGLHTAWVMHKILSKP